MKKAHTWIITCFYLQLLLLNPLVKAQSPCGNPVTDDVNDITKLVGNLPNDYLITLRYVRKMDTLPKYCWLHLMVPEISTSLHMLLQKFSDLSDMSDVLSNYSIINNLTRIIHDIMSCLGPEKIKSFRKGNDHLYEGGSFVPEEFFKYFNKTIDAYKDFEETSDHRDCILPTTTETPENDSKGSVTSPFVLPPVAASSLRNESSGTNSQVQMDLSSSLSNHGTTACLMELALNFTSSPSLKGISIGLAPLFSLLIGFTLGAICWKKTHRSPRPENDETTQCNNCEEENEISMLQQKEKEHLQV